MEAATDTVKSFDDTEEIVNGDHKEEKKRSRTVAGILALLFGTVGAHKFYQGKYAQGVLFLLFFWTFVPGILGTIEGVHLLGSDEEDSIEDDEDYSDNIDSDSDEADLNEADFDEADSDEADSDETGSDETEQ